MLRAHPEPVGSLEEASLRCSPGREPGAAQCAGRTIRACSTRLLSLIGLLGLLSACGARPAEAPGEDPEGRARPLSRLAEIEDLDPAEGVIHGRLVAEAREGAAPWRYAYNGLNPGPLIRGRVGDRLVIDLENRLSVGTTIHWHGLKVPYEMDGVPWMREPVQPMASSRIEFELTHAGTYWYHPHFDTEGQVDGGLYGVVIVEDPAEPRADVEVALVFDVEQEDDPGRRSRPPGHAHGHGRLRSAWRVNGERAPVVFEGRGGQVVRARLINASNVGYLDLRWPGIRHIAGDQGLLEGLETPDRLVLGPGDRADVEWLLGPEGFDVEAWPWSLNGGEALGAPEALVRVSVEAPGPAPAGLAWPFGGRAPTADSGRLDVLYALNGSDRSNTWRINGQHFHEGTIETVPFGAEVIMEVRNLSPTEHPFHLHGLPFEVLSVNGVGVARRTMEDTINLRIRDRVRLRIEADNAGDWMAHCHILPHAEDGMMAVFRVLAP